MNGAPQNTVKKGLPNKGKPRDTHCKQLCKVL